MNDSEIRKKMGYKKVKAEKPSYKNPTHVEGIGVMEKDQAEKFYPQYKHTPMNESEELLENPFLIGAGIRAALGAARNFFAKRAAQSAIPAATTIKPNPTRLGTTIKPNPSRTSSLERNVKDVGKNNIPTKDIASTVAPAVTAGIGAGGTIAALNSLPKKQSDQPTPSKPVSQPKAKPAEPEQYTIQKGDTAWKFAKDRNISLDDLKASNPHIKDLAVIKPGDKFNMPTVKPAEPKQPKPVQQSEPKAEPKAEPKHVAPKPVQQSEPKVIADVKPKFDPKQDVADALKSAQFDADAEDSIRKAAISADADSAINSASSDADAELKTIKKVKNESMIYEDINHELRHHLDDHISQFKTTGNKDGLTERCHTAAMNIAKMHNINARKAAAIVYDYVESRLKEDYDPIKYMFESYLSLDEGVSSSSKDYYLFAHGRKPSGNASWLFSTVHPKQHDMDKHDVFSHSGSFSDAQRAAVSHFKMRGHKGEVHVLS